MGWLGMSAAEDQELFWIAREGLRAPLPEGWRPCRTPEGDIFYYNMVAGDSVWEHPCDEFYRAAYTRERHDFRRRLRGSGHHGAGYGHQGGRTAPSSHNGIRGA